MYDYDTLHYITPVVTAATGIITKCYKKIG